MGQGTDTCTERPTEVSVIRFVSRNRTIEEIAPKKEVYTCKQRGCGKIFTNQDEFKTHEALEALKIRFICREPGCGEELSDPGSMWRHYQEWHNNETNVFICPYTNCGSLHSTSSNLEEHIESCHRQPPTLPTEPEVICFEDTENVMDEEVVQSTEDSYEKRTNETFGIKEHQYEDSEQSILRNDNVQQQKKEAARNQSVPNDGANKEEYSSTAESLNESSGFSVTENLILSTENFLSKYEGNANKCSSELQVEHSQEKSNVVYVNGDITITKNSKNEACNMNSRNQEHRIELDNLERIFRTDLDRETSKNEENAIETNSNCSDDEEYTPKKQRMSRYKQEIYKCAVNGCGRKYKYISHYRHHQDSHKLVANTINSNSNKSIVKLKQGKASTVSFFLCKIPGCGAQVSNVTGLWKHYQDNHANSKLPVVQGTKNNEVFRCKIPGCETEFSTTVMLYKHFSEVHSNGTGNNASTNTKTGNGSSFHYTEMFKDDATSPQANFKTDFKAKHNINVNDCTKSTDEQRLSSAVKKEARD